MQDGLLSPSSLLQPHPLTSRRWRLWCVCSVSGISVPLSQQRRENVSHKDKKRSGSYQTTVLNAWGKIIATKVIWCYPMPVTSLLGALRPRSTNPVNEKSSVSRFVTVRDVTVLFGFVLCLHLFCKVCFIMICIISPIMSSVSVSGF